MLRNLTFLALLFTTLKAQDIVGPVGSGSFGSQVLVLSNGNFVISDPTYDDGAIADVGAVYLYDASLNLISTLKGSTANDQIGQNVYALKNGNFVVVSQLWDNGATANVGAVTWCNGTTGLNGVVSASNSLIGSTANDNVGGTIGSVTALPNGHYVVRSQSWDNGAILNAGAVTWCNGATGMVGVVSSANSIVGSTNFDGIGGTPITVLSNSNYVINAPSWDNGAVTDVGAIIWCSGTATSAGTISSSNALIGSTASDNVGSSTTIALTNGNYVVRSTQWDNGAFTNAGAATWGNGTSGTVGVISSSNSLVGSKSNDAVGQIVTPLTNGNYVVNSPAWDNAAVMDAGASTWGNGSSGTTGVITAANSLVGTNIFDQVGFGCNALTNGNYVVRSKDWDSGKGAATWGDGTVGVVGAVSIANSITGIGTGDNVGTTGFVLKNGHFVLCSPNFDNGATLNVGAATWMDGTMPTTGNVSAANSIIGVTANDNVGSAIGYSFLNGDFILCSPNWDNGALTNVGAITRCVGSAPVIGTVNATNSFIGSTANDFVGNNFITILPNGNYVLTVSSFDNGAITDAGAVVQLSGATTGSISIANALVGSTASDRVGLTGRGDSVLFLSNNNYMIFSRDWDNGAISNARHVTFCDGTTPVTGTVTAGNSFLGSVSSGILDYVPDRINNRFAIQKPLVNTVTIYPVIASCNNPSLPTLSATFSSVCEGNSTTLSVSAGTLNDATDWHWYTGSCGGTAVGTGMSLNVSPTSTTTYYVRGEGGCVSPGLCEEITITVNPAVTPSVSIAANPGLSNNTGTSVTFTATPTNGGTPTYQWLNNGTLISGETAATYTGVAGTDFFDNDIISCEMTSTATCASPTTVTSNTLTMDVTVSAAGFATGFGFPTTNEIPNAITKDGTGNIYVGGTVGNTGFITKFSNTGTVIWTKIYGTTVNGVVVNQSGNPVIVGGFTGATVFGGLAYTPMSTTNSTDAFVAILDPSNGNVNSAVKFGANSIDLANAIAVDETDNFYIAGEFNKTVDFDPNIGAQNRTSLGLRDAFVVKLDENLAFQWVYTVGAGSSDKALGVAVGDEVYVTGQYSNGMSGLISAGANDGFVTKISKSSGTMIWERSFGSESAEDKGNSIALDASNNVYVAGVFGGSTFALTSAGVSDALIFSYDNNGTLRWAKKGGAGGKDIANSISVNGTDVLTTGLVRSGTGSFTGAPNGLNGTSGTNDVFVVKYHTNGSFACLRLMSGSGDQDGRAIWAGSGNYALTGSNAGTLGVEIDDLTTIPITTTGLNDIFVMSGTTCSAGAMKMDNSLIDQTISSEISLEFDRYCS